MTGDYLQQPRTFGTDISNLTPNGRNLPAKKMVGQSLKDTASPHRKGKSVSSPAKALFAPLSTIPPSTPTEKFSSPSILKQSPAIKTPKSQGRSPRNTDGSWRIKEVAPITPRAAEEFQHLVQVYEKKIPLSPSPFTPVSNPPFRVRTPPLTPSLLTAEEFKQKDEESSLTLVYDRDFLLSFQNLCVEAPEGLLPEISRTKKSPLRKIFDEVVIGEELEEEEEDLINDPEELDDEEPEIVFTPERIISLPKPDFVELPNGKSPRTSGLVRPRETDPARLVARQKQLDIGKSTAGYQTYSDLIPREERKKGDPRTPNKNQICSKRSWDGQVRKWRRQLHFYDPPEIQAEDALKEEVYQSSYESINAPIFYLSLSQAL